VEDRQGNPVPECLRKVFTAGELASHLKRMHSVRQALDAGGTAAAFRGLARSYPYLDVADLGVRLREADEALVAAAEAMQEALPHAVCLSCGGAGCGRCQRCGYLSAGRFAETNTAGRSDD